MDLIKKLQEKVIGKEKQKFVMQKKLISHKQPLTNLQFNKYGTQFITGSYDNTCRLWKSETGEKLQTFKGHKNVVYSVCFNNPYGNRVFTGSFDKTAKIWDTETGNCLATL